MFATLLFIAGFSLGMGAVAWIILAEIVPSRIRARSFSIFTAINWGSNFFVGLYTLTAINAMGQWLLPASSDSTSHASGEEDESSLTRNQQKAGVAGLYAVFAAACVVAVAFIFVFVRETMGKSLEELEGKGKGGDGVTGEVGSEMGLPHAYFEGELHELADQEYALLQEDQEQDQDQEQRENVGGDVDTIRRVAL